MSAICPAGGLNLSIDVSDQLFDCVFINSTQAFVDRASQPVYQFFVGHGVIADCRFSIANLLGTSREAGIGRIMKLEDSLRQSEIGNRQSAMSQGLPFPPALSSRAASRNSSDCVSAKSTRSTMPTTAA